MDIFTLLELEQIRILIKDNIEEGSYYGRKDYWDKRNTDILRKISEIEGD